MTINDTIHLFEQLARQTHLQKTPQDLLTKQTTEIQQAIAQNDNQAIKASFCPPDLLANKTTIFNV